ncbi:MAG: molybdopterin-dependent oxidoreductase [Gemmatimonadaceae bacterium]
MGGEVPRPLVLTVSDLRAMPRVNAVATDHNGGSATYDGVPLAAVLERAGVTFGSQLRGPRVATFVVVDASDGYRAVFAIAELDPAITAKVVLVVDRKNGAPLAPEDGPLRIVVPDEKRPVRWVRQIIGIRVVSAPAPDEGVDKEECLGSSEIHRHNGSRGTTAERKSEILRGLLW